jgi:hypothetical protein
MVAGPLKTSSKLFQENFMKNKFLLLAGLALVAGPILVPERAYGYASADGVDPRNSEGNLAGDVETKQVVKSAVAGSSEALIAGIFVAYDQTADDGYTVTRAVTQSAAGHKRLACLMVVDVATNDTNYHRCITRGFAKVRYRAANFTIEDGRPACVDAAGYVRGCNLSIAEATANTGIIPLETKSAGDGTDLKVMINLQ